jgi:threonine/homoserine/homoserine lactone efflux protein
MLEFVVAVVLLELTPGPNMAYLATLALARGRAAGLLATLGVALGLAVHAVVTVFGAGTLIAQYPWLYETLRWTGVAYLLYLAWEGWWPERENSPSRADLLSTAGPLFWRGFFSNVFNPKSILFFVSVVPTFVRTAPGATAMPFQMAALGIVYVGIATAIHAAIVILAAELRPWLVEGPRQQRARRILSAAIVLVVVWLAWSTRR